MAGNKQGLQTGSQEHSALMEGKLRHQLKHGTGSAQRSQGSRNQQCPSLDPQEMSPVQVAPPSDPQEGCEQYMLGCAGLGLHLAKYLQHFLLACKSILPSLIYREFGKFKK